MKAYIFLLCLLFMQIASAKQARVVLIIVIDHFNAHYLEKLKPHLTGGLGMLSSNGVKYLNAFYDHAMPGTGPGHFLLSTGTYGSVHGIVNNTWYDEHGNSLACDADTTQNAAVFNPRGGFHPFGKSARLSLADTLSDQLTLHSYPHMNNSVWSVSLKSRAAIAMAGRLGKAVWFDETTGLYTSSKAYFKQLPTWLKNFNAHLEKRACSFSWIPLKESAAYSFIHAHNYEHSRISSLMGKQMTLDGGFKLYQKTPFANAELLDLAYTCFEKNYSPKKNDRFVLWMSLSSLDKVCHTFGPDSKEALDMVYQMDAQLMAFFKKIEKKVPSDELLVVLTADHSGQSIPELLNKRGLDIARRYPVKDCIKNMNTFLKQKYHQDNIIYRYKESQFYLDPKKLAALPAGLQKQLYNDVKKRVRALPGVKRVWTFDELQNTCFAEYDLDKYLARQLFRGRSGQIIFSVNPYASLDTHTMGTNHATQYAYDSQVPLIFYQKGRFEKKKIYSNVFIPQVSVTLATLLNVPRPSAAFASVLPGLAYNQKETL